MHLILTLVGLAHVINTIYAEGECIYKADIAVVIDLCEENANLWTRTRIFIKDLIDKLPIDTEQIRIGVITSSPEAAVRFSLDQHNAAYSKFSVDVIGPPVGCGDIGNTLKLLESLFFNESANDRNNVQDFVLFVTDGISMKKSSYNIYDSNGKLLYAKYVEQNTTRPATRITPSQSTLLPTTSKDGVLLSGEPRNSSLQQNGGADTEIAKNTTIIQSEGLGNFTNGTDTRNATVRITLATRPPTRVTTRPTPRHTDGDDIVLGMRTRLIIHVTANYTPSMIHLATPYSADFNNSSFFSTLEVVKVEELIKQLSVNNCTPGTTVIVRANTTRFQGTTRPTTSRPTSIIPDLCRNLPCYSNEDCVRSKDENNVVTCECERKWQSKYCPSTVQQYGIPEDNKVCTKNTDKTSYTAQGCDSHIDMVCPSYGPNVGGTDLFIWGRNFSSKTPPVVVLQPMFICDVAYYNATFIQCRTRQVSTFDIKGSLMSLIVEQPDGCRSDLNSAFHYRGTPNVTNVRPLKISPGGGQTLTVIGEELDADVSPRLHVIVANDVKQRMFASVCEVHSNTVLICKSPRLDLATMISSDKRSKRSADSTSDLHYTLGLSFPGFTNLSNLGQLTVGKDPVIHSFTNKNMVKTFRPSWPEFHKTIHVKGQDMLDSFEIKDYTVMIGGEFCVISDVTSSLITCMPPSKQPASITSYPEVRVFYGREIIKVGYLRYDHSPWGNSGFRGGVSFAIVFCSVLLLGLLACCLYLVCRRAPEKQKPILAEENKNMYLVGDYLDPNVDLRLALGPALQEKVSSMLLIPEYVKEENVILNGAQGLVYSGWMLDAQKNQTKKLMIKAFKEKGAPFIQIERFLEAAVLLRDCDHRNILACSGIVINRNLPRAVYPCMENGNLKHHLVDLKEKVMRVDFREMLHFCKDAAEGLAYLHDNSIVHEDIAARNCWIDKQSVVKIGDAALSRDLFESEYYLPGEKLRPLPVRWMSPESLTHKVFTYKSDIWSFGVLLWEIMSLGELPYASLNNVHVHDHVDKGNRLTKPDLSTVAMYTLMLKCWAKEHKKRPNMKDILKDMESFVEGEFLNPTLARPHIGKKGLSVLTTPLATNGAVGGSDKPRFIKNSVQHDNLAYVPDDDEIKFKDLEKTDKPPRSENVYMTQRSLDKEKDLYRQDYEAEYEYLKPDFLSVKGNKPQSRDVVVDDGLLPDTVENKTYDVTIVGRNNGIDSNDVAIAIDDHGIYSVPKPPRAVDEASNHGNMTSGHGDAKPRLTGIKAPTLESDGYKMENDLNDSVLY